MTAPPFLRQPRHLLALEEHRSFTRAAAACHVTPSSLSAGSKELEAALGADLGECDRRTVAITSLGAKVAARVRPPIAHAEDLAEPCAAAAAPMRKTLRLDVVPTIASFLLPRLLPKLPANHPKLRLLPREQLSADLVERLVSAQIDFALTALPCDTGELLVEPPSGDGFWLAGRADDPAFGRRRVAVDAKDAGRLLLLEYGHCLRRQTLAACTCGAAPNVSGIEATGLLTLGQMVGSDPGLARIPEIAIKDGLIGRPDLVARPLAHPAHERTLALVARRTSARSADFRLPAEFSRESHSREVLGTLTPRGRTAGGQVARHAGKAAADARRRLS